MNPSQTFITLSLIVLIITLCQAYPTFDNYVHDYMKNYSSIQQYERRKVIYEKRVASFDEITDYTPGVNNLTDRSQEEINALKNYQPSRTDQMLGQQTKQQNNGHISVAIPSTLDWRTSKAITSIKTQGYLCGACWAFSVAAYVESKLIIEKGYGIGVDLSQQYLVSCTNGSNCNGGYAEDAMQVVANKGIPYEASFPYNPAGNVNSHICFANNTVTEAGNKARWLRNVTDAKIIDLLQQGPLSISISGDGWENYLSGIYKCQPNSTVNHGVLLVGYTQDYWIAKNQWGKTWGESGYIRITRSRNESYTNCYIGRLVTYMDPIAQSTSFSSFIRYSLSLVVPLMILIMIF